LQESSAGVLEHSQPLQPQLKYIQRPVERLLTMVHAKLTHCILRIFLASSGLMIDTRGGLPVTTVGCCCCE
jgi:hypothetical protein